MAVAVGVCRALAEWENMAKFSRLVIGGLKLCAETAFLNVLTRFNSISVRDLIAAYN